MSELLEFAYVGSKGCKSNAQVVMLLADYQTFNHDSQLAHWELLNTITKALECHKTALKLVDAHEMTNALKALSMTSKFAEKMISVAADLQHKIESLIRHSANTMVNIEEEYEADKNQPDSTTHCLESEQSTLHEKTDPESASNRNKTRRVRELSCTTCLCGLLRVFVQL